MARERLIAATPALLARRMAKNLRWEQVIAERLLERGWQPPGATGGTEAALGLSRFPVGGNLIRNG